MGMRVLLALLLLVVFAMAGLASIQSGLQDTAEPTEIDNETFTPDTTVIELSQSNLDGAYYNSTVEVWDENNTKVEEGTDYEWYVKNGTIRPLAGGELDGDSEASITYGYERPSKEEREMAGLLALIPRTGGFLLLLIPLFMLLIFARGG